MNHQGCKHVLNYKLTHLKDFRELHSCFIACHSNESLKVKARLTKCFTCGSRAWRLHACLYCIFVGCYEGRHIHEHAQKLNHSLAADLDHGQIHCFVCKDYVYDSELDLIMKRNKLKAAKALGIKQPYYPWEPTAKEMEVLRLNHIRVSLSEHPYIGLRGLVNQGNTCYFNCLLQVFLHTATLRNFLFSNHHNAGENEAKFKCLICELYKLFQEFYAAKKDPFVPYEFLFLVWEHCPELCVEGEYDFQEVFLKVVRKLEEHCKGFNDNGCTSSANIIEECFHGKSLQTIICKNCNYVSHKTVSFYDISLDIVKYDFSTSDFMNNSEGGKHDAICEKANSQVLGMANLIDCLRKFTHLDSNTNMKCDRCEKIENLTLQTSFKKLPTVLALQLKRFKQIYKRSKWILEKNHAFISFPEMLDMREFLCSTLNDDDERETTAFDDCRYSLFAVVVHIGDDFRTGHFVTYIRQHRDRWFYCNDNIIVKVNLLDVLKSNGYVLFYQKHTLEYH